MEAQAKRSTEQIYNAKHFGYSLETDRRLIHRTELYALTCSSEDINKISFRFLNFYSILSYHPITHLVQYTHSQP
jgi:hypothetical protein